MDKDEAMAARMKMDADEFESETEGAEVEGEIEDTSPTLTLTVDEFNEIKSQQAELMRMLKSEQEQRQQMAETLATVQQTSAVPLTKPGEPVVLLEGREWGPFSDYEWVTTPYGEYGVPLPQVLSFVGVQRFNQKKGIMELVPIPRYRTATDEEKAAAKVPSMEPLPTSKIAPPTTIEESMRKMAEYLEGRSGQGFTHEPVKADV